MFSRRALIGSLISLVAAPAIVRVSSIMPVKAIETDIYEEVARSISRQLYGDLADITRKAFVPRLFVQVYHRTPLLYALSEHAHG